MYVTKLIRRYLNKKAMKKKGKDIEMIDISEEEKKAFAEKFKGIELFKHLNDDAICWVVFIFYLSWMQENENEKLWEDFKEEMLLIMHQLNCVKVQFYTERGNIPTKILLRIKS